MEASELQLQLNIRQAIRLLEAKGYALHSEVALKACLRRCIARSMQMPKISSSTDEHVVKVFQENVPRTW
eukprot:1176375-Pleurochrysis_carterae.AAC.1